MIAAPLLVMVGLALVFMGERLIGGESTWRTAADVVGVLTLLGGGGLGFSRAWCWP